MAPNTNEAQQEKLRQLESRLRQTGAAQACGEARGEAVKINGVYVVCMMGFTWI
jgi:hypothetical protein